MVQHLCKCRGVTSMLCVRAGYYDTRVYSNAKRLQVGPVTPRVSDSHQDGERKLQ